jgi:hypothetical protein
MERILLRVSPATAFLLALSVMVHAQQVASKDLVRETVTNKEATAAENPQEAEQTSGCSKMGVGFADGVTLAEDHRPRKLKVELVEISTKKLTIGSEIIATAKLQNMGAKQVQVPWSTDFQTTMTGQDPDNRSWEFAEFRMSIRDKKNPQYYDQLVTTSQPLYGSWFDPESQLTIAPGKWITVRISFKVAVARPQFEELNVGKNTLAMEWFQTHRSRVVKNCGVTLGYFPYDDQVESLNRREIAKVKIESPDETKKPSQ